jgi:hypothetical protein
MFKFLLACVAVVMLCATAEAGPFGRRGGGGCSSGGCNSGGSGGCQTSGSSGCKINSNVNSATAADLLRVPAVSDPTKSADTPKLEDEARMRVRARAKAKARLEAEQLATLKRKVTNPQYAAFCDPANDRISKSFDVKPSTARYLAAK